MEKALRISLLTATAAGLFLSAAAQKDRFAYAVTGLQRNTTEWSQIRRFDLQTGTYTNYLFDGHNNKAPVFDAVTKEALAPASGPQPVPTSPFASGVAAMAYDKAHQRLYFTPMFEGQLRYLDLRSGKLFFVTGKPLMTHDLRQPDGGKVVTRMVIAPDGYGYAITNDGQHMTRFSTGRKPEMVQLGSLIDAPENKGISISAACTGYGGDMVADDAGNLYIITARNHVFRVTTANRVATYLATINGLPPQFTVNGAVVDDEGQLLVSSGVDERDYFRVNPQTWKATAIGGVNIFRSSDLANSNFLHTRPATVPVALSSINMPVTRNTRNIQLYPNPATGGTINLQFHKVAPGDYNIDLVDILGRMVQSQRVAVSFEGQTQTLNLPKVHAKAVYLVRVTDRSRKLAFEEKVVVQ